MGQWFLDSGLRQDFGILEMNGIRAAYRAVKIQPPCCLGGTPALIPSETDEQEDLASERAHVCPECNDSFETLRQLVAHQTHKNGYRHQSWHCHSDQHVCMVSVATFTEIDERPVFIINSHGNGDTVRGGVVICTLRSYPSILHAPTVINISNQSPCCLSICEQFFLWKGMQNWALTQSSGTPEARPQRTKRPRGAQGQPNPHTQKQMLLILSRLALKHDLEIRELQAATFHTLLVKEDEPLTAGEQRSQRGFLWQNRRREPHVLWICGHDDGHDHGPSTLGGRQAESGDIHVQCELTGDSPAEHLLEPVQKNNISEGLDQVAVFSGLPDSAHLVPHHQSYEIANFNIMQAGGKGRQQLLTSWIRAKLPCFVQLGTGNRGGQRLLTSWMRPKSSSAPTVSSVPVSAMGNTLLQLLRFVPQRFPWWRTFLQHQPRSTGPVWRTSCASVNWTVTGVDTILLAYGKVVRTFFCEVYFAVSLSCSQRSFERIPRALWEISACGRVVRFLRTIWFIF